MVSLGPRAGFRVLAVVSFLLVVPLLTVGGDDTAGTVAAKEVEFDADAEPVPKLTDDAIVQEVGSVDFILHCGPGYVNQESDVVTVGLSTTKDANDLDLTLIYDDRAIVDGVPVQVSQNDCISGTTVPVSVKVLADWDKIAPAGRVDPVTFTVTAPQADPVEVSGNLTVPAWLSVAPGPEPEPVTLFTGVADAQGEATITWSAAANGPLQARYETPTARLVDLDYAWHPDHTDAQGKLRVRATVATNDTGALPDERSEEAVDVPITITSTVDPNVTVAFSKPVTIRVVPPPEGGTPGDETTEDDGSDDGKAAEGPAPAAVVLVALTVLAGALARRSRAP